MSRGKSLLVLVVLTVVFFFFASDYAGENPVEMSSTQDVVSTSAKHTYDKLELETRINEITDTRKGNWSVYVKIPGETFGIEINNREVTAASTIKLYNMVTFFDNIKNDEIKASELDYKHLELMITESSNVSSNYIVQVCGDGSFYTGADEVTDLAYVLGCYSTQEEHMLYDTGGHYAPGRNTTSVRDLGILLEKIYKGECVSPEYDKQMIELMKQQKRTWKIPSGVPDGIEVANKTGETSRVELDTAIVFSPACDYIICIGVTDFNGAPVYSTFEDVSRVVYEFFNGESV